MLPNLAFFRHALGFRAEELVYFQNQFRLSWQDPDRMLQCDTRMSSAELPLVC